MEFLNRSVFNVICIVTVLCSFEVKSSDNKNLETPAEAKIDHPGQLKAKKQSNNDLTDNLLKKHWQSDLESDVLQQGLTQAELAAVLKERFYGTFVFYRRLNSVDQETVYNHYLSSSSADIDSIRQVILNHLKKKR